MIVHEMLIKENYTAEEIAFLLTLKDGEKKRLFEKAAQVKEMHVQNKVYLRGLIEFSNCCSKNCFYCGIRSDNEEVKRYNLSDEEILASVRFAYESRYNSVVLQSGELKSTGFTKRIEALL